ncbi:MAG TPA: glycosyltransferase [Gaiellaceae bacterium]|nr:glycosyltransferase [Gaiellaceae bacterium]
MTGPTPIRVLLACQPLHSGVPHHVLDLVRSFDPARYRIALACPRESVLWGELEGSSVELHAISPARQPRPADLWTLRTLLRLVRGADVVHGHSAKAGFLIRFAALLTGRRSRCVFTPHGWSFWSAGGATARLYLLLERLAARWCRTIITLSADERDAGLTGGVASRAAYEVIPNGVELARFAAPPMPVPGRILMIGRFAPPKRHDLVLRAFADVHAGLPGSELWLVGAGDGLPAAERLATELGVADSTRFLGVRDDVPALLTEAACVVLASDYEGCPLSVIEAMAAGVPVVATSVGGVPELVEDGVTGFVTAPGRADELSSSLATLLADGSAAARMGAAGRALAEERYSRERMGAATERVYARIVADPAHSRAT